MVIAVASGKGGTGKSTITLNLAGTLSAMHHKVFVVDADPQGSISQWAKTCRQEEPVVIVNPSPVLGPRVRKTMNKFELILFDTPPTFKKRMRAVLKVADRLIIPVTPGLADFWSTRKLIDMYLDMKEKRPKLDARLLISRIDRRTRVGREFRPFLEGLNIPLFITEIPQRTVYAETWTSGRTVDRIQPNGPAAREFRALAEEVLLWLGGAWRVR